MLAALLGGAAPAAASDLRLFGAIEGEVRNLGGVSQMGAAVFLFNRFERPIQKALTGADGKFRFDGLPPDQYSVRVNLNSYVPASRSNIAVKAGMSSYLTIQLATIFSTIELIYTTPGHAPAVSDEWKWVLRSANAMRPVLRLMPQLDDLLPSARQASERRMFSATRGMMRVSAGDSGFSSTLGNEPDLGTAFALATSLFGGNELRVSGNVGYATSTGAPATGFRTRYARTNESSMTPDVELTVRQIGLGHVAGQGLLSGPASGAAVPLLRTMSVKLQDRQQVTEDISIDYGLVMESVVFLQRMNLMSPYARLTYDLGEAGTVEVGYSSGAPALDLIAGGGTDSLMQSDLAGLAMFPRVSLRDGHARVQRSENYEVGYRKVEGKRTYSASFYQEVVRDAAMTVAAPAGTIPSADLLPDIASHSSIFNMGGYTAVGYMASVFQDLGAGWSAGGAYGAGGALHPLDTATPSNEASELRSRFRPVRRQWASARLSGFVPGPRTRVGVSYVWTPGGTLAPAHAWLTQRWQPQMGLNLQLRQPLPGLVGGPGRWEMNAELRNLLAEGYIPVATADGRSLYLIQFPRTLRGGLSFIF